MTIAQCLAVIDRLCSEDFPAEHSGSFGGSYGGPGGPGEQGDERIPEPWASLGSHMRNAQVWEAAGTGRRVALGISRLGEDQEFRLLAVITETDPP